MILVKLQKHIDNKKAIKQIILSLFVNFQEAYNFSLLSLALLLV
jgi:hypothetical protein